MDELDKKLEEIVMYLLDGTQPENVDISNGNTIETIKQAFIDAGWRPPYEATPGATTNLVMGIEASRSDGTPDKQYSVVELGRTYRTNSSVRPPLSIVLSGRSPLLMTGQEWYDNFVTEFMITPPEVLARNTDLILDYVFLVARKASGIDEAAQ